MDHWYDGLQQEPEPLLTREELAQVLKIHPRSVKRHYLTPCGKIVPGARGERYSWREVNEYIGAQGNPQEKPPLQYLRPGRPGYRGRMEKGAKRPELDPFRHGF